MSAELVVVGPAGRAVRSTLNADQRELGIFDRWEIHLTGQPVAILMLNRWYFAQGARHALHVSRILNGFRIDHVHIVDTRITANARDVVRRLCLAMVRGELPIPPPPGAPNQHLTHVFKAAVSTTAAYVERWGPLEATLAEQHHA